MAKQLRVFLDNKPGRLEKVTGILASKGINVRVMFISDRGDFGIAKFLVDNPDAAFVALSEAGFAAAIKDIIAVYVEDSPGRLHDMIKLLSSKNVNISDGYGFAAESVFCIEVEESAVISALLKENGFRLLSGPELYGL